MLLLVSQRSATWTPALQWGCEVAERPTGLDSSLPRPRAAHADPGWELDVTLVLVEDDAGDALLVEEYLADSALNLGLTWCKTLAEAQTVLARTAGPLCVLLDLHLPDVHGLDAVRRVLTVAPDAAIIVLTGLAESEIGLDAVALGAQDYLVKNRVDPETLGRAVRYAVQRKVVERASAALQVSRLRAEENARLELGLLPTPLLRTVPADFSVVSRYEPGRDHALLGGDFYDVVQTADGTVHAVVGDVSGHGAAEAALGVCLRVAWRAAVLTGCVGSDQARLLNEILCAERAGEHVFATYVSLRFDPDRRTLHTVRAGHHGSIIRTPGGIEWYEPEGGMALGLLGPDMPTSAWPEAVRAVEPDTAVVSFTDGLFEGRTGPGTRLGESGLLDLARHHNDLAGPDFVRTLVEKVAELAAPAGGLSDDLAVLHLAWEKKS
ncbi:PP2C family protein-serine/threonine phosphatase [Streptomyces sp. NPDC001255]|uniref:PP2C family protein-serine/threonine phosphatase n=1 Tax=Streptomyces sp. NPDC001255 TaxID=3364550 RepID=UPI00367FFB5C